MCFTFLYLFRTVEQFYMEKHYRIKSFSFLLLIFFFFCFCCCCCCCCCYCCCYCWWWWWQWRWLWWSWLLTWYWRMTRRSEERRRDGECCMNMESCLYITPPRKMCGLYYEWMNDWMNLIHFQGSKLVGCVVCATSLCSQEVSSIF